MRVDLAEPVLLLPHLTAGPGGKQSGDDTQLWFAGLSCRSRSVAPALAERSLRRSDSPRRLRARASVSAAAIRLRRAQIARGRLRLADAEDEPAAGRHDWPSRRAGRRREPSLPRHRDPLDAEDRGPRARGGLPPSRARLRPPSQGSARLLRATPVRKARAALLEGAPRRVGLRLPAACSRLSLSSMEKVSGPESWNAVLQKHRPLVLPAAHDALSARLIQSAGFPAYQIGGFALVGARYGQPDIDLIHLGERRAAVRDIMSATSLPVLVDLDDGYGDAKNVTFAVRCMEGLRVSAVFIEDQEAPKKCGQNEDKKVIPVEAMVAKIRGAVAARSSPDAMYVIARTDSLAPEGMKKALKRGEKYLHAGADALYVEGLSSDDELHEVAKEFKGTPLVHTMMEGGGESPWHSPREFGE